MGPEELDRILGGLPRFTPHQKVLVGNETHDDAGVYWLNNQEALVQTIDYFTPVVDDAQLFGRIAAVNSLSDVYAMGGRPITALNLLGLPSGKLPPEMVSAMLTGGTRVMESAGVAVLGGHSVDDPEPKMGYAVTGLVHPDHIWRNSTSRVGDRLYLTKPIGTGLIIKAMKDSVAQVDEIEAATAMMTHPNQAAAEAIKTLGDPSACTDVTGFGLLGHSWEMAEGAGVTIVIDSARVPLLPGAYHYAVMDRFPAGSRDNLEFVAAHLNEKLADRALLGLLADAVTSGGLLFSMPAEQHEELTRAFVRHGIALAQIGEVQEGPPSVRVL